MLRIVLLLAPSLLLGACQSSGTSGQTAALAPSTPNATADAEATLSPTDAPDQQDALRDEALAGLLRGRTMNAKGVRRNGRNFRWKLQLNPDDTFAFSAPGGRRSRGAGTWRVVDDRICWKIAGRTERCATIKRKDGETYTFIPTRRTKWTVPSTFTLT